MSLYHFLVLASFARLTGGKLPPAQRGKWERLRALGPELTQRHCLVLVLPIFVMRAKQCRSLGRPWMKHCPVSLSYTPLSVLNRDLVRWEQWPFSQDLRKTFPRHIRNFPPHHGGLIRLLVIFIHWEKHIFGDFLYKIAILPPSDHIWSNVRRLVPRLSFSRLQTSFYCFTAAENHRCAWALQI